MTTLREAAQQALEALEEARASMQYGGVYDRAITALRDALATGDKLSPTVARDEIIRMAREAGFNPVAFMGSNAELFDRFAALVAAAEREVCAMVAECADTLAYPPEIAAAIREIGNQ